MRCVWFKTIWTTRTFTLIIRALIRDNLSSWAETVFNRRSRRIYLHRYILRLVSLAQNDTVRIARSEWHDVEGYTQQTQKGLRLKPLFTYYADMAESFLRCFKAFNSKYSTQDAKIEQTKTANGWHQPHKSLVTSIPNAFANTPITLDSGTWKI